MRTKKVAAIYAIIVGIMIIFLWGVLILTDQVPEFEDEPMRILFHIVGELLTAIALITSGFGLALNKKWGFSLYLVAVGMLSYTIVVSPGYYAQQGESIFVGMFVVLWIITVTLIALIFRKESEFRDVEQRDG